MFSEGEDQTQFVRNISKWPLSKVDLVIYEDAPYIRKTINKDFRDEIQRQLLLSRFLENEDLAIPKILHVAVNNKAVFLMEYIDSESTVSEQEASKVIDIFHNITQNVEDPVFPIYSYESFLKELNYVQKSVCEVEVNKNDIKELFNLPHSIVHGDWNKTQVIKSKGKYYILDWGKSFRGPSILDYGFQSVETRSIEISDKYSKEQLRLAQICASTRIIAWYLLCKEKYINYSYEKEINNLVNLIRE
jgi:hypothetical protein